MANVEVALLRTENDMLKAQLRKAEHRADQLYDLATNALGREPDELDIGEETETP